MVRSALYTGLLAAIAAAPASAVILYATAYNNHTLYGLNYDPKGPSLTVVSKSTDCGQQPTWLTLDKSKSVLYCLNEGWDPSVGPSTITSYRTKADGTLQVLGKIDVVKSPVSSVIYGPGGNGLAVAHYDTSTFSSYDVSNPAKLVLLQNETYTGPLGPDNKEGGRQTAPHEHDAILDPSKKFLLVPDLGSDLVRLYAIQSGTNKWKALEPVKAVAGSGPRHGAFASTNAKRTFFYTLNELSNTITGYSVTYGNAGYAASIAMTQLFTISDHGGNAPLPAGTGAAEIEVSSDQKFLTISSRGENSLTIPNFDPKNSTAIPSDPLITFEINQSTGALNLVQIASAGGRRPRGFSINKAGTLVASALQDDNRVVIIERDPKTGKLGKFLASATVGEGEGNGPPSVIFNEC